MGILTLYCLLYKIKYSPDITTITNYLTTRGPIDHFLDRKLGSLYMKRNNKSVCFVSFPNSASVKGHSELQKLKKASKLDHISYMIYVNS